MKKGFKLMALAFIAILLAGCKMKANYQIEIGKDKNVTLQFIVAYDDEMIDTMISMKDSGNSSSSSSSTHTDQERWDYLESSANEGDSYKDFKKEKYDKDGFKGYTYTLSLGNIDNLVADGNATDIDKIGKDSKIFTKSGNVYKINIKQSDSDVQQFNQYKSSIGFDVNMVVKLPSEAKSNNATSVDKTTYTWDLTQTNSVDLEFELANNNTTIIIIIVAAAVAVIAIVGGVVFFITKKKKEDKDNK